MVDKQHSNHQCVKESNAGGGGFLWVRYRLARGKKILFYIVLKYMF